MAEVIERLLADMSAPTPAPQDDESKELDALRVLAAQKAFE